MKKIVVLLLSVLTVVMLCTSCAPPKDSGVGGNSGKTITITFNTDGKVDVPKVEVPVGEAPAIPEAPVVDGFVFAGWYFDAEFENRYFFDYPLEENTTLYAKFYDTSLGEYIVISNVDQLIAINDDPTAKYLLACNINCKGNTLEPIAEFSGELEGNGYKIFNFSYNSDVDALAFIITNNGIIRNLSFDDFSYTVVRDSNCNKVYALVCGNNYGTVENCKAMGGVLKIDYKSGHNPGNTNGTGHFNTDVAGIVAYNGGVVKNCVNYVNYEIKGGAWGAANSYWGGHWNYYSISIMSIGGVVGRNAEGATIFECINYASFDLSYVRTNSLGRNQLKIGGLVGHNEGEIQNCYAQSEYKLSQDEQVSVSSEEDMIGGFVGLNIGKIYNCYCDVDITANQKLYAVGGFVGENRHVSTKESLVSKCFAFGSITVDSALTNCGLFAGLNTGTVWTCNYADTFAFNLKTVAVDEESGEEVETITPVEATCSDGEAMAEAELLSVNYLENTLYFDRMVWLLVEGKLPALR